MPLNPLSTTSLIDQRYRNYLKTTFKINNEDIYNIFNKEISKYPFIKGPIIETTPPFKKGCTLQKLINDDILSSHFLLLNLDALPLERPLYLHQEIAIRKAVQERRNIVVATGTGSGKTEIFMITILNELFRQKEKGTLNPGVRALLLYPMNALVNDQLKRMRELFKGFTDVTFGRYTGETLEKQKDALDKYKKIYGSNPLPNEIISREEMREAPPHILLTNYAMLEYLLLRPRDNTFFDGQYAQEWSFIVLDEAHTYNGAKGIEMAMLIRRLKDRVVMSKSGVIKSIATSATLGGGEQDNLDVARFASQLFSEEFSADDVIGSIKEEVEFSDQWGTPQAELYIAWQRYITREHEKPDVQELYAIGKKHGIPIDTLNDAIDYANNNFEAFIYYILEGDARLQAIQKQLRDDPKELNELYNILFQESSEKRDSLVALVELAGKARRFTSDRSLLSARYHLFVRTVEGAYISFFPEKKVYLEPNQLIHEQGSSYPVFELGTCGYCGATFLVGKIDRSTGTGKLKQKILPFYEDEEPVQHFFLNSSFSYEAEDEDDTVELENVSTISGENYSLCGKCGSIDKSSRIGSICTCGENYAIHLIHIHYSGDTLHKCPLCKKINRAGPVISRFFMGKDAIPMVLATAIYQELPDVIPKTNIPSDGDSDPSDEWAPVPGSSQDSTQVLDAKKINRRNLLIFSDSRQDAAFFAPYLNQSYNKIIRRALILQVIKENKKRILENKWVISDLVSPLLKKVIEYNIKQNHTKEACTREINRWLFYEFISGNVQWSLENLALCGFRLIKPDGWSVPPPLLRSPWNLTPDEGWTLYQILLDHFRTSGAIRFPDGVSPTDDFFRPRNFQFYFRENDSSAKRHIKSWVPHHQFSNSRLDYLVRLSRHLSKDISESSCRDILNKIWKNLGIAQKTPFNPYFIQESLGSEGIGFLMDPNRWEIVSPFINPDIPWFKCDLCNVVTLHNIRGFCPTYRCEGRLYQLDADAFSRENHYRILYTDQEPVSMIAEEHTAQLSYEAATELQQQFLDGMVNVLSCSTTFELGVDVGELEAVFMRNMPPSAANYIQRAGRAGRRTDSTAFVTTFCQRRSHDLTHFKDPMTFVKGIITPPHFEIKNEKIVKRHVFATALAAFWRKHPDTFNDVDTFFFNNEMDVPAVFLSFLQDHHPDLEAALRRIVPDDLHPVIGLDTGEFINDLYYDNEDRPEQGLMTKATNTVREDIQALIDIYRERTGKLQSVESIRYIINTIKKRPIIDFFSSHNIIPKYGFPVDVVELQVMYHSEASRKLKLQRDLRIALSEYAPGGQIVASGKIWESKYIKRDPKRGWLSYNYVICQDCHRYHRVLSSFNRELTQCDACNADLRRSKRKGIFIIPEFGFITDDSKPKGVTEKRPPKTYSTRVYFSGDYQPHKTETMQLNNNITLRAESASHGQLAIINNAGGRGFSVCSQCGYAILRKDGLTTSHHTPFGRKCNGRMMKVDLGHEYFTDILKLEFDGFFNTESFWISLLYALLEGLSTSLGINRDDLDGCLYPVKGNVHEPAIILFDNVPGGAGHVKRAIETPNSLLSLLQSSYLKVKHCTCGGDLAQSSCYGCLRNYQNQFCHEYLDRRIVIDFLRDYVPEGII